MKTAEQWLDQYGESHQNRTNKLIHWVCIPAIVVSLFGLLASIPVPWDVAHVNVATVLLAFSLGFYMLISTRLAVGMLFAGTAMYAVAVSLTALSVPLWASSLAIFVAAWIAQFIGHKIEGKKPSFFEDLQFLLIGPLWLLGFIYRKAGLKY